MTKPIDLAALEAVAARFAAATCDTSDDGIEESAAGDAVSEAFDGPTLLALLFRARRADELERLGREWTSSCDESLNTVQAWHRDRTSEDADARFRAASERQSAATRALFNALAVKS